MSIFKADSGSFKSVQVTGSLIVTDTIVTNTINAQTSSIQYITSSQLNIGTNLITLNSNTPSVRFGGIAVIDSGSSPQRSGSILFDSQNNQWIFIHQGSAGADITSSVFIQGPQTFNNIGNETTLTTNRIPKATGGDLGEHIGDSNITDNGTTISINSNTNITGSLTVTQFVSASSFTGSLQGSASYAITASYALTAQTLLGSVASASFAATASSVNTLTQNVLITGSLTVGSSSVGSTENTLIIGPPPAAASGEGGQILLQPGYGFSSASMMDLYESANKPFWRLLRGTIASSDAIVIQANMHTKQVAFPAYNSSTAFTGTAVGYLAVDSSGNILTTTNQSSTSGVGANPTSSFTQTITHGLGRTPVKIRIYGASQFTSNASATATPFSMGVWSSSGNTCIYQPYNTAAITTTQIATSSVTFSARIDTAANVFTQGVIQNVGATTFDIAWTATGTPAVRTYLWEAE